MYIKKEIWENLCKIQTELEAADHLLNVKKYFQFTLCRQNAKKSREMARQFWEVTQLYERFIWSHDLRKSHLFVRVHLGISLVTKKTKLVWYDYRNICTSSLIIFLMQYPQKHEWTPALQ